jgi:hypothetical protein
MIDLVAGGHMTAEQARDIADRIHRSNPLFITKAIVDRFTARSHRPPSTEDPTRVKGEPERTGGAGTVGSRRDGADRFRTSIRGAVALLPDLLIAVPDPLRLNPGAARVRAEAKAGADPDAATRRFGRVVRIVNRGAPSGTV